MDPADPLTELFDLSLDGVALEEAERITARRMLTIMSMAPDSQLDVVMRDRIKALLERPATTWRFALHQMLDECARFSLASGFTLHLLDFVWRSLGGLPTDPAPWRSSWMGPSTEDTIDSEMSEE